MSARDLPSVDRLLRDPLLERLPRELALQAARDVLDDARRATLNGGWTFSVADLPGLVEQRVRAATSPRLRPVLNASGVIIHTNLGRAPLSRAALDAARNATEGYSNLEYDLDAGERGSRHTLVTELLGRLTGAEDALVTNNNAAAVLLILTALGQGGEAIISRGQLVEIGGGFRIPDVMPARRGRSGLGLAARHVALWAGHRADGPGERGRRRGVDRLLGRQAAGRSAGGHHRRSRQRDRPLAQAPADARHSPRQTDAGRAGRDAGALPARRGRARGARVADDRGCVRGARGASAAAGSAAWCNRGRNAFGDRWRLAPGPDTAELGRPPRLARA